jgi:hypothetical protein
LMKKSLTIRLWEDNKVIRAAFN